MTSPVWISLDRSNQPDHLMEAYDRSVMEDEARRLLAGVCPLGEDDWSAFDDDSVERAVRDRGAPSEPVSRPVRLDQIVIS